MGSQVCSIRQECIFQVESKILPDTELYQKNYLLYRMEVYEPLVIKSEPLEYESAQHDPDAGV